MRAEKIKGLETKFCGKTSKERSQILHKKSGKNLIEGSLLYYIVQKTRQMIASVPPDNKISSLGVWKNLHFKALRTLAQ